MPKEDEPWRSALEAHESDRYAHAPILLSLHDEITDLQKLGWMVRGGLVTLGIMIGGGFLVTLLHLLKVI